MTDKTWIKVKDQLPPDETNVLLLYRNETIYEGSMAWEKPTFEETFEPFRYFQNADGTADWEWHDITHWMPKPPLPSA